MPRDYAFAELPTKSDMKEDLHLKLEDMGYTKVVHSVEDLGEAVSNISNLKIGYRFDNALAIETLKKVMEAE